MTTERYYVVFASSFRYDAAPSHAPAQEDR